MADTANTAVEDLSEEEKLVEAQELPNKIQELIARLTDAEDRRKYAEGAYSAVRDVDGIAGMIATAIERKKIAESGKEAETYRAMLGDARVRRADITYDLMSNFERDDTKPLAEEQVRLEQLELDALRALQDAFANKDISGAEYAERLSKIQDHIGDADLHDAGSEYNSVSDEEKKRRRAKDITGAWLKDLKINAWTMMKKGGLLVGPSSPIMRRAGQFFRGGRFTPVAGLNALGPGGHMAAGALTAGKMYYDFVRRVYEGVNRNENNALLSGVDLGTMKGFGVGLGAYGGSEDEGRALTSNIARTLGGMKYGQQGGHMMQAAMMFGTNILGSGFGGLATPEEYLMAIADDMRDVKKFSKEELAFRASIYGVSASVLRMMQGGPDEFAKRLHEHDYVTNLINRNEIVEDTVEVKGIEAEIAALKELVKQRFTVSWLNRMVLGVEKFALSKLADSDAQWESLGFEAPKGMPLIDWMVDLEGNDYWGAKDYAEWSDDFKRARLNEMEDFYAEKAARKKVLLGKSLRSDEEDAEILKLNEQMKKAYQSIVAGALSLEGTNESVERMNLLKKVEERYKQVAPRVYTGKSNEKLTRGKFYAPDYIEKYRTKEDTVVDGEQLPVKDNARDNGGAGVSSSTDSIRNGGQGAPVNERASQGGAFEVDDELKQLRERQRRKRAGEIVTDEVMSDGKTPVVEKTEVVSGGVAVSADGKTPVVEKTEVGAENAIPTAAVEPLPTVDAEDTTSAVIPSSIVYDNSNQSNEVNIDVQKVEVTSNAASYQGLGEDIGTGIVDASAPAARRAILNEFGGGSGLV